MTGFYKFAKTLCHIFSVIAFDVKVYGVENIPKSGGFILASNHITNLDPVLLGGCLNRQLNFMAKKELFKNKLFGKILLGVGAFPVDRGNSDNTAIDKAVQTVKDNNILAIFPEGTRSKDGELRRFKSGAMFVANKTRGDVVPTAVYMPNGMGFRKKVYIKYGEAIKHGDLLLDEDNPRTIKKASSLVRDKIQDLLDYLKEEHMHNSQKKGCNS